jgi:PhnB protein
MAQLTPYLTYGGNCKEAFEFYRQHLGATDVMVLPFRGTPAEADVPEDWRDKTLHASLQIGGFVLMASDCPPGVPFKGMEGISVVLNAASGAEAKRWYEALAQGGKITMPLGETFWADGFAMVTDQFGAPWMIMHEGTKNQ